ncbi:uncharacterized protein METZ01_LOCUS60028 [marine metagenome]|uniref:PEGA domain-containing protein n=1 Tax=marine metagenome TaxID=408172 RepID=A0A381SUU6_9ZZZZ|tara:strand:- start:186 stop:1565 length:1380 start_codon:yes stop_codon:yes gene_type:complete
MRGKILHLLLFVPLLTLLASESVLKDVKYDVKSNGIMLSLDYTRPIPDDNIIGWKSDRNWLYLTLLGVKPPATQVPKLVFNGHIKEIVIDDFDESVQIAVLMGKPIHWYDIVNSQSSASSIVFIHTELNKSQIANIKRHLDQDGESVFSRVPRQGFPAYNTNFKSAFEKARMELGPNALFKYKGKLYHTNHPNETTGELISGLQEKTESLTDYFDRYAVAYKEDGEAEWDDGLSFQPPESGSGLERQPDEYFIDDESGEELVEWKNFSDQQDDQYSVDELMAELNEHSLGRDEIKGPVVQSQKSSWWQRLPFLSKTENNISGRNKKWDDRYLLVGQSAIRVDTNIDGVPIYIDGRYVGHTPLSNAIRVEPGWHQVSGFSPQYLMYLNTGTISYVDNDPMLHNQMFGTETVYVESGKIARSEMRFDYVGPSLPIKRKNGGWLVGFPIVVLFFQLLAWGAT